MSYTNFPRNLEDALRDCRKAVNTDHLFSVVPTAELFIDLIERIIRLEKTGAGINDWDEGYVTAIQDAVKEVYKTCTHTKYLGCEPCIHDTIVASFNVLKG